MPSTAGRIAFFADIHYKSDKTPGKYWTPPENLGVEAILLGGDIHYTPEHLGNMLAAFRKTQPDETLLVAVPGNGDYIDQDLAEAKIQYREAVSKVKNAVFLDDEVLELPSGTRIIGSTLWSLVDDDKVDQYMAMVTRNGAKGVDNIRIGDSFLTVHGTNELHRKARAFIEKELRSLTPEQRSHTIVGTHYWPTHRWLTDQTEANPAEWKQMISTDLESLIADCGPRYWLCGHLHETHHVTIGKTEVTANPMVGGGPGGLNPDFNNTFVVDVS